MSVSEAPKQLSRRTLLQTGSAAIAAAWAGPATALGEPGPVSGKVPMGTLGRTGARVSRLGIGCAHFQYDRVTREDMEEILDRAGTLGINYLDIAPNYGDAEEKFGPVLKSVRDRFFLVTKTEDKTYAGTWKLLRQSMKKLRTDHLDLVHVHNFGLESRFPDPKAVFAKTGGTMAALREAKKRGVLRFIGATGHLYPSRFRFVTDSGEIDVLMNAVNFVVRHVYNFENKVWATARRKNIGLVAMKVLGGKTTAKSPDGSQPPCRIPSEHYKTAIRYALSIEGLSTALVGVENARQIDQAARAVMNYKPFTPAEAKAAQETGAKLARAKQWAKAYGTPLT